MRTPIHIAVGLFLLIIQVVFGCMDLNIRARDGTLKCVQCDECKAGYEPYPACHTDEIFDEVGLVKMCIECKADFFKQVHEGKPNTLMCKPCATVKCRDNYVVLQNCTRSSPPVCSNRCMIGFAKDAFGNCIKKIGTDDTDLTPTWNPTKKSTAGTTAGGTPLPSMGTTKKSSETTKKSPGKSTPDTILWVPLVLAIFLCALFGLICWKRESLRRIIKGAYTPQRDEVVAAEQGHQNEEQDEDNVVVQRPDIVQYKGTRAESMSLTTESHHNKGQAEDTEVVQRPDIVQYRGTRAERTSLTTDSHHNKEQDEDALVVQMPATPSDDENICCVCKTLADKLLHTLPEIFQKMDAMAHHLPQEKHVCNAIFNWLSGQSLLNNRIENTRDLYKKIHAEVTGVTVAKFFSAFVNTEMGGIPEKIHDAFHPEKDRIPPVEDRVPPVEDRVPPVEDRVPPVEDRVPPVEDRVPPVEDRIPLDS